MISEEELAKLLTVTQVAKRFKRGRPCVHAWINKGVLANGKRVKLAAHRIGGSYMIHPEQLDAFFAAANPHTATEQQPESPAAARRRGLAAKARTAAMFAGVPS